MWVGWLVVCAGVVEVVVSLLGRAERLPRNHWVGIRTRTTLRDDETWRAAHQESWPITAFAGIVAIGLGLYLVLSESYTPSLVSLPLLLIPPIVAGMVGHAAAKKVVEGYRDL